MSQKPLTKLDENSKWALNLSTYFSMTPNYVITIKLLKEHYAKT
jgi:hypothetical protein